jgi:DNA-binding transcriptional ArsR family regulator
VEYAGDKAQDSLEKGIWRLVSYQCEENTVREKRECREETLPLPPEVEEALCRCGGIAGLIGRLPEDEVLESESALFRALADPLRLKILAMLAVQPLCVCVIREVLGIADSKLSYHLGVLKKVGLIAGEAQGNWIIYSLTDLGSVAWARRIRAAVD